MNLLRFQLFERPASGKPGSYKLKATYRDLEEALGTSQSYDWLLWDRFNQQFIENDRNVTKPDPDGNIMPGQYYMHPDVWGIE